MLLGTDGKNALFTCITKAYCDELGSFKAYNIPIYTSILHAYCIVPSTSPSCFEAHAGLFRLLMKDIFDTYGL